ncbi:MAG: hypothetical protein QM757_18710 [Paludibaculum sp.]
MSELARIILSSGPEVRNRSLDSFCRAASAETLLAECEELEALRRDSDNLYTRVRALFFLSSDPPHVSGRQADGVAPQGRVPFDGLHTSPRTAALKRPSDASSQAQRAAGPQRRPISAAPSPPPTAASPSKPSPIRSAAASAVCAATSGCSAPAIPPTSPSACGPSCSRPRADGLFPILREATPVRMDLSHSGWSDIFFLGMDFPEGARVLNVSIDLAVRGRGGSTPQPPVEAYLRVIDEPVLRLVSVDLGATADITSLAEVFDFARDYLGLLKAAVIAAGIVPPGMEGSGQSLVRTPRHASPDARATASRSSARSTTFPRARGWPFPLTCSPA